MNFLEISIFFGRLHPLLVHLPIGFLILAVVLSSLQIERNTTFNRILRLIWILSFISALFSALMGWLLAQNGHYIQEALSLHQWTGIALVFFSALGWIFNLQVFNISINIESSDSNLRLICCIDVIITPEFFLSVLNEKSFPPQYLDIFIE